MDGCLVAAAARQTQNMTVVIVMFRAIVMFRLLDRKHHGPPSTRGCRMGGRGEDGDLCDCVGERLHWREVHAQVLLDWRDTKAQIWTQGMSSPYSETLRSQRPRSHASSARSSPSRSLSRGVEVLQEVGGAGQGAGGGEGVRAFDNGAEVAPDCTEDTGAGIAGDPAGRGGTGDKSGGKGVDDATDACGQADTEDVVGHDNGAGRGEKAGGVAVMTAPALVSM